MRHPLHVALSVSQAYPAYLAAPAYPAYPAYPASQAYPAAPSYPPFGAAAPPAPPVAARHRRPRTSPVRVALAALVSVPPARRLAAGLGLASVLAASVLTVAVEPSAPVAPDRAPARRSSTFAQVSGD
ncbi:hypothetical protein [Streptomyces sp. NBC_00096]|uniref:hypothetical protein n=1 Tax=Streptomyces sp. NBC_00096 TaxID=2975650 RepID=UPI00324BF20C